MSASAVVAAGIGPALSGDGSFTVFAPPNSAFEELFTPELAQKYLNPIWLPQLQDLLLYHALGSEVFSTDLADGAEVDTLNFSGDSITVNLDPPRLNDDSIILVREGLVDIKACNGVVRGVSKVLLPTSATNDIVDIGMASEDFSTLVAAVEASGLVETLKGEGPFTLFGTSTRVTQPKFDNNMVSRLTSDFIYQPQPTTPLPPSRRGPSRRSSSRRISTHSSRS